MVDSIQSGNQYERRFSLGKTMTSAATGAALFRISNDALMRKNAQQTLRTIYNGGLSADVFVTKEGTAMVNGVRKEAEEVLANTGYFKKISHYVKNPVEAFTNAKTAALKALDTVKSGKLNFDNVKETVLKTVKSSADKAGEVAKGLKGKPIKETLENVLKTVKNATKTVKGRQKFNVALGAVCGLLLFGTSKVVHSNEKRA